MLIPGYVTRGQGVRKGDKFGTIRQFAAEIDGEDFVLVKFRDGEELVSVLELFPANQLQSYTNAGDAEVEDEENVVGEVEDPTTPEIETIVFLRDTELVEDDEEEIFIPEEEEVEAEMTEEF